MKQFLLGTVIVILGGIAPIAHIHPAIAIATSCIGFLLQLKAFRSLKQKIDFAEEVMRKYLETHDELEALKAKS